MRDDNWQLSSYIPGSGLKSPVSVKHIYKGRGVAQRLVDLTMSRASKPERKNYKRVRPSISKISGAGRAGRGKTHPGNVTLAAL